MADYYTWEINGVSVPFDMEDAETAQKYHAAIPIVEQFGQNDMLKNDADCIRSDCNVMRSFFAALFGEETADAIFKDVPINRRFYLNVYESFLSFIYRQTLAAAERIVKIANQYAPGKQGGGTDESAV
jgi:hypothetical protein